MIGLLKRIGRLEKQTEKFYNCFEMNDGRRVLLLGMHARILDEDFKTESIHVYDTSNSFGHHSDLGQEQGTFEPICSRQGYDNGASNFLIGFKLY